MLAKTSATTARVVSVVVVVVAVVVAARWCWWWWVLGELQRNAASAQSPTPAIWVVAGMQRDPGLHARHLVVV
jgi:hypothetical protein